MRHPAKSNGSLSLKIFQISEFESQASKRTICRTHAFRKLTTRRHYPGRHELSIRVNGAEKTHIRFQPVD
jgi:hypothetical protein